ncbi:uncharacterized protein LOC123721014 [Papilio machaon]|uniref:uncharacterized protein LOC123721014 n=1 Tax=Papilio machaon TaxID=76193 RepID=UPI001E663D50|nr:uncharacterized protein LOC123721014 [Papilio machaon]
MPRHLHFDLLQTNTNHCARAQDLLMQCLAEWRIAVAVVAEPYFVPPQPSWFGDTEGLVAIVVPPSSPQPLSLRERGAGYVAVNWGEVVLIGVYFSPNRNLRQFERFLDGLEPVVQRASPAQVIVMGDLNAKCAAWGSSITDLKGALLRDWAAMIGLVPENQGNANTCVRRQGGSVVDVTFATPGIGARISCWRVLEEVETLSDHLYIRFRVSTAPQESQARTAATGQRGAQGFPKWQLSRLDPDLAEEAAIVRAWAEEPPQTVGVDERAVRFRRDLTAVCNAGMPRARRGFAPRKGVYWWSQDLAALRSASNAARRAFTRCRRRRNRTEEELERLYTELSSAKKAFSSAIKAAKDSAYAEFLATLDADPWGRPYRMVRAKLKVAPPTETMEPAVLSAVVEGLFPDSPLLYHRA